MVDSSPLQMTTAYNSGTDVVSSRGTGHAARLPYIPLHLPLYDGSLVVIDFLRTPEDERIVKDLLNDRIKEGESWPFLEILDDREFRNYFFAHTALVARSKDGQVVGAFYCKPNFPGRCSHFCNGGFLTHPNWRRCGVASAMVTAYLRVAKDLGFRAVLFNLVFASNVASVRLWEKFGFTRIGVLPGCGHMQSGISDAYQYYYDLEKLVPHTQ